MRRHFLFVSTFTLLAPLAALADDTIHAPVMGNATLGSFIALIIQASYWVIIPGIALAIIYSGFLFVSAQGDVKKIDAAKGWLKGAVIAAAVVFSAQAIVAIVSNTGTALLGQ